MIPDVLVIGKKSWDKLTTEQQTVLKKAGKESMMYHKDLWTKMIGEAVEEAKTKMDVKFVSVEKQPFIDAVKPMHDAALQNEAIAQYVKEIDALAK